VFGDVSIDNFANITAAGGDGIQTTEFGAGGNISVTDEASTTITANRFGIYADSYSSGNISILTSNNDVIDSTAGGEAIFAINNALAVPIGSTIDVTARGTILSGSKTFAGFTAVAAGIVPAYNANGTATNSVAGNVRVDDFASITTPAGTDGIRAYNEGIGTVAVIAESTANIAAGGNGISAFGAGGGNVSVTNGGTVSGSFGIQATGHLGGNVVVINNGANFQRH
jgi:large repetitive protein